MSNFTRCPKTSEGGVSQEERNGGLPDSLIGPLYYISITYRLQAFKCAC